MLAALVIGMIGHEQGATGNYFCKACFFFHLSHRAVLQGLSFIELALGKIPFAPPEYEQRFSRIVPYQSTCRLHQQEFLPERFAQGSKILMQENAGMHFFQPHLMDDRIDGWIGEFIDEHRIIMVGIAVYLCVELITEEQRLVVEIDLDVHGGNSMQYTTRR